MEQFVLGIFQEHLSKFVIGFRKEQVNANLLNGKGEITDISLNCSYLNEELRKVTPYIEFESVHISKLSCKVTSWTNIRHSPVIVSVGSITAVLREPRHYSHYTTDSPNTSNSNNTTNDPRRQRRQHRPQKIRQVTFGEFLDLVKAGSLPKPRSSSSYNVLLDRIIDNITIEIHSIRVTYHPLGSLRTTRTNTNQPGPWTPPAVRLQLFGLRLVSVDEYGHEISGNNNSADERRRKSNHHPPHHHHHHHRHNHRRQDGGSFIYKKIETEYQISMVVVAPAAVAAAQERALPLEEETTIPLISSSPLTGNHTNSNNNSNGSCRNNRKKIQVQLAYQRRIRDGEFLKLQVDATVPLIEVQLVASTIPVLAHFAWAMQHCLAQTHNNNEDTNRTDPFSPRPNNNRSSSSQNATNTNATAAVSTAASVAPGNGADVPQLQQPPTTTTMVSDSTSLLDLDLEDDDDVSDSSTDDNDDDDSVSDSDSDEEDEDEFSEGNAVGEDLQDPDERKAMSGNGKSGEETADDSPMVNPMRSSSIAPQTQPAAPATTTFKTKFAATTDDRPLLVFPNGLVFHEKVSISFSVHNVRIRTSETGSSDNYFEIIAKGVMAEALWPTITNEKGGYLQASMAHISVNERHSNRLRSLLVGGEQVDHAGPVENASKPSVAVSHEDCFPFFEDRALRPDPVGLKYTFPAQALGIKLTMSMAKKYAAESGQNVQKDEVSVLSEIGVDKFTIVVGSASWRRALRFFLNTDHGGFDSRWHTGDYSEYLSREMMVDVAAPLPQVNQDKAGEKFIQNWCLSVTDLLNATMRVTNIVLQVQAPVCFDRRSCDINIALDEVMLTISSALPRTLFGDEKSQFETIEFPNDPSDVIYNIYGPELNVSSLEISTFRCQQKVKGLSLQLIPLISTSAFALPQQRVLSTDVTMIFSFEAQRAEQSSNCSLGTIAVVVSMLVHRFEMNIDFDYFVSIGNTVSLQFSTETVDVPTTNVDPNERIVDTMAHRRLVQRLLRKHNIVTERFCTAFNLRIVESKIRHWRQNVSLRHALLLCQEGFNDATPCLLLWDGEMKEADICFEDDFSTGNGRVVLKLSIDAFGVRVCDFDGFFRANPGPIAQDLLTDTPMMILLSCDERDRTRSLACRIEETLGASLTWALSLELNNAAFSCPIDNLITLWFIWVDALFIPFPSNSRAKSKIRFPPGTLGHYVVSLMSDKSTAALSSLISKRTSRCGLAVTPAPSLKFSIERVVQSILTQGMLFPTDMLLVRCAMNDVTFHFEAKKFNDPQDDSFNFGLTLLEFEFLASNFLSEASTIFKSFDVLVHRKEKWSSKITSQSKGLRHSLRSRLTLLANGSRNPKSGRSSESNCSDKYENESDCSDNYEFGYSYENSNISLSIPENVVLGHMLALRDWFESFQRITEQYIPSWGRFKDNRAVTDQTEVIRALNYLHHACSSTNTSLRELQARHESLQNKFNGYHRLSQKIGIDKDLEIASLRALVFVKEKERFSALSLVSSEASGWLGVGSANVSGQRGLLSSMVWQHWVVLRHSSLLLFGAPGQYGMVDFVALEGATMRELTGEKRHADLKRAFSIVELSGTTHFFVAGNDADFVNWVVAIQRAINLFSVASPDVENSVPVGNESIPYNLGQDGDIVVSQENGITTPLNQSLTTPVETVRMDQSDFGRSNQSDGRNGLDGFEPTAGNSIDVAVDSLCGTIDVDVPVSNVAPRGQDWRREQVRNRFVGVSQATKSRFGSAMSAARQKGKEVAQKGKAMAQKRLDGTTSSFDVRKNEGSTIHGESKSCPSCPLLNTGLDVKSQICALKRSDANSDEHETTRRLGKNGSLLGISTDVLSSSNLPLQSDQVVCDEPKPVPSNSEPDEFTSIGAKTENGVLDQNNADDFDDRTESDRPVGMKQRIGAVVRRAIAQSDNQRLLNGRLGTKLDSSDVFTNGAIESVKLERISLSRALSTPFHPFGKGDKGISGLELKCVEGVWTIRVEIVAPEFKRTANGVENDHLASEVTTGVAEPLGDKMEDDTGIASASTSSNADFMYPVAGKDDTLSQVKCLDHTTTKSTRLSQYFRIQVFEHKSDLTISPVELQKSLSEILQFHSSMSESIAKVSSHQFSPDAMTGNPFQPCTHGDIAKAAGLSALETVCISGSLLGECFENSKSTENYSSACISSFLNAIVSAPLPLDCLAQVTEFLHIANSSLTPGQSKGDESTEGNSMITRDIDGELCDVYAREIVTVSSTCGQELLRAYYNNNVADALTLSLKDVYSDATNNASMLPPAPLPSRRTSNLPSNVHESELTHSALLEVMEERDRIHCHMVSESILHAYEVDELKERIGNLTSQIRESKKESDSAQSTGNDNDDKKLDGSSSHYRTEKSIQQDTEAELLSLCQQLAGEISARTEACLEVIRLQESRKIEREQYVAERQSLQDEVWQLRQRVNEQSEEIETAQQAVDVWKSAFEKCAALHPQAKMQDDA